MVEGARLESVYTLTAYRGFESLSLRQIQENRRKAVFLCLVESADLMRTLRVRPNGRIAVWHSRKAARRARAMDGPSESLSLRQIQEHRRKAGFLCLFVNKQVICGHGHCSFGVHSI